MGIHLFTHPLDSLKRRIKYGSAFVDGRLEGPKKTNIREEWEPAAGKGYSFSSLEGIINTPDKGAVKAEGLRFTEPDKYWLLCGEEKFSSVSKDNPGFDSIQVNLSEYVFFYSFGKKGLEFLPPVKTEIDEIHDVMYVVAHYNALGQIVQNIENKLERVIGGDFSKRRQDYRAAKALVASGPLEDYILNAQNLPDAYSLRSKISTSALPLNQLRTEKKPRTKKLSVMIPIMLAASLTTGLAAGYFFPQNVKDIYNNIPAIHAMILGDSLNESSTIIPTQTSVLGFTVADPTPTHYPTFTPDPTSTLAPTMFGPTPIYPTPTMPAELREILTVDGADICQYNDRLYIDCNSCQINFNYVQKIHTMPPGQPSVLELINGGTLYISENAELSTLSTKLYLMQNNPDKPHVLALNDTLLTIAYEGSGMPTYPTCE
jgi:hypothetical protein